MDELGLRLMLLANIVVPLLFFMAAVYLALHILFARFVDRPGARSCGSSASSPGR